MSASGLEDDAARHAPASDDPGSTLPEQLERHEAQIIRQQLDLHHGDVRQTIAALGIARKTFYDKLARHGISRSDYVLRDD